MSNNNLGYHIYNIGNIFTDYHLVVYAVAACALRQPFSLGIDTAVRLLNLDSANRDAKTARVASRLRHTSINPNAPRAVDAVRAGQETGPVEVEVAGLIEGEGCAFTIAGRGLCASCVAQLALT
jgi:hypothetical protein